MLINEKNLDQIIKTIQTLHQTTTDQRPINLNEYLTEFFQSIQQEHSNLFSLLKQLLHDYEDRTALKIEFLKAHCLETISRLLNNNEDNIISILQLTIELLKDSENVQEKFLEFNGYQKIFQSLRYVHSPGVDFIDQLIILMIEKSPLENVDLDSFVIFINPHITLSLIYWIPYLTNVSYQHHIISSIDKIVLGSLQNKMMACSNGIIDALIKILPNNKFPEKVLLKIFSLIENLSQFSIDTEEIRLICQLFNQNTPFKKQLLRILITAAKHIDPDSKPISSYFDLQRSNSGIILPIIRRWPSVQVSSHHHHFSFHCWLRLNHEVDSYPHDGRRQIYSFYSDSMGLESFIRNSSIFILISDRREVVYIEIPDCDDLIDGYWHSLTIVHTAQRPSLFVSAFQTTLTCHLTIYIDGLFRKEIKDFKYVTIINDPITLASIGSSSQRPKSSILKVPNESTTFAKRMQPLKFLFTSKTKSPISRQENQGFYSQNVITIDPDSQETFFGQSNCLYGQLACAWVLAETLDEMQVKHLHAMGADFCHQYRGSIPDDNTSISSTILDFLHNRSLLAYHPLACNGQICVDISGCLSQMNGRLNSGSCLRLHSFTESLLSLGGCSILYPLIEFFEENDYEDSKNFALSNENKKSEKSLPEIDNPIALIIDLIRYILSSPPTIILTEQITKHFHIEILKKYLNHIPSSFIDQQLLMSIEKFIESSRSIDSSCLLTNQLVQHILLDFSLWNKAKFHVRISHIQYITKMIKNTTKYDQEKFGVQYFFDIIKQDFNLSQEDTDEEKQIRSAIYEIIRYFIQNHIRLKDLNVILSSISTLSTSNDEITNELLDFIHSLLVSPLTTTETTDELLCEPNIVEELYSLLIVNRLSSETKEILLKIMKYFIGSKEVSQQVRAQLRLETNHIGFGGIISGLSLDELNISIVQEILNIILSSNSSTAVHHLNVVLTLCSAASIDIRFIAIRKLMAYFISHSSACHLYAKCDGWQETLAHFLVKTRRSSLAQLLSITSAASNDIHSKSLKEQILDPSEENLTNDSNPQLSSTSALELSSSTDDLIKERSDHKIDLPPIADLTSDLDLTETYASSPSPTKSVRTPLGFSINREYSSSDFRRQSTDTTMTPPQSASASREDLLSLLNTENSNNNSPATVRNYRHPLSSLPRRIISTSMPQLSDNEEINRKHKPLGSLLRQFLGLRSIDDSKFLIRSSVKIDDGGILEEMCETLILAIIMILWKGIVDSDDAAWMIRGQIFSALRHLHREYELYLPLEYIERRILELSMEACLNDVKSEEAHHGYHRFYRRRISLSSIHKQKPIYENNCRELIKLVNDFISQSPVNHDRITENLVQGILPILDTMLIFKKTGADDQPISHDEHWSETSLTGLNILLTLLAHPNISFCSQACIRIHSLLNCRPLNGREEAAYLLSNVNKVFLPISHNENSKYYTFLLPLMKIIINKSYDLLQIPNISLYKTTEDFRQYISSTNNEEWEMFIRKVTEPYADHYRSMSVRPFHMNMQIWWNNCHEMMNIAIHKRNRQIGVEKLNFQNQIVHPWHHRARLDEQRMSKLHEQHRIHQIHVNREWKNRTKYLYDQRGPWLNNKNLPERRWMLSDRENIHRMRCKLIENDYFNKHEESSRLRDNLAIDSTVESEQNIHREISKEGLLESSTDEHDLLHISAENQSFLFEEKEIMIIGTKCSLITSTSVTDGELMITDKYIYFFDSTPFKTCRNDLKYPLLWLEDIHLRRYNLRPSALEFFLINQINFLLNFPKNLRKKIYQKLMLLKLPSIKSLFPGLLTTLTPKEILRESKITEKWISHEMSNFDYLMMLNTIAGRTYNDLNQYPVFPWVLKDYTSKVLDIHDSNIYRDFSKPIGIQNPKHIEEVKFKYESFEDPSGLIQKFHYGTHYSNAASVMHYLIRMEPFTTLHIQLQSGKFDIADRQFHSFQSSWINIMDSPNDGKELIPEFFYLPEFLTNSNKFDLGKLQLDDQLLNDVQLPPWAHNSPEEFIRIHRAALESDYVSAHLHEWIDLIFGYKQSGQTAIDALNVFMYCSYETAADADMIDDSITREAIDGMIQNFGQIPSQLLTEPHPQRHIREQAIAQVELYGHVLNIFHNLTTIRAFFVEITPDHDKLYAPITFISIPKNQIRSFMQQGTPDILVTINTNGVVGNNGWQPYDKSSNNFFVFERDPTLQMERNRLTTSAPFSPSIEITPRLFAVSHDAKFIFSGGHWDSSLRIYSLFKSKTITSIIRHTDIITCLTLDSTGYILVTGSRDTTCVIWYVPLNDSRYIFNINDQETTSFIIPEKTLYGHTAEVTCVCVSSELDLVVSGSLDGTCNIHTIERGVYIRTLRPTDHVFDPIANLKLSDERHILVQTENEETHLFLYSINGSLIRTRKFEYRVVDMLLSDTYILLAVNHNSSSEKETESTSVAARIIIKDMFQMTTIQIIRLRTHINCLYLTKDYSHLLVAVKDGKLFVLTPEKKSGAKHLMRN